jgi:two-component system, sensor histidine kinase and response regulator
MPAGRLLQRQLKRLFGATDEQELQTQLALLSLPADGVEPDEIVLQREALQRFFSAVDDSYEQHQRDLDLSTRSLDLSSAELTQANDRLRSQAQTLIGVFNELRGTANSLLMSLERAPLGDDEGDLGRLVSLMGELVREREQSQIALKQALNALGQQKFAIDQYAIVSITDVNGKITYANDRFIAISGYARDELLGQNHRIIKSGLHSFNFFVDLWATINAGRVWSGEICNRAKTGKLYWVAATIVPFMGADGKPEQFIAIRTDITARKYLEESLVSARDSAEAANRAKSEFLATMSHEIRTPMNGIIGMTELALDTPLNAQQHEYLEVVRSSADALLAIIDDILDFSKIEAGKLNIEQVVFDLPHLVEGLLKPFRMQAAAKNIALTYAMAPAVPSHLRGDPVRLRQILVNLIGNALKFTPAGGVSIEIGTAGRTEDAMDLCICVRDTGIGIPAEKLGHIFDAFSQADGSTARRYGGTGLGLAICRRLVALMGGVLNVESVHGSGSAFRFSVRVGIAVHSADSAFMAPTQPRGTRYRLLLAEDHPVNQKIIMAVLGKSNHSVVLAENGRIAIELAKLERFDAILMDMQMPEVSGLEATAAIRAHEVATGAIRTPIIALTANAMQSDRDRCLAVGMDDHIAKPMRTDELHEKLARWIEAPGVQPG